MGMRDQLNNNRRLGVGVGAAIMIVAVGVIAFQLRGDGGAELPPGPTEAFYTDDGGKTFFKDDINKIVPFDHNGKEAYRADVFQGPDGEQFVGLIYRHTAIGKTQMQDYLANKPKDPTGVLRSGIEVRGGMEVRRSSAGDKSWTMAYGETRENLRETMKTPSGAAAELVVP